MPSCKNRCCLKKVQILIFPPKARLEVDFYWIWILSQLLHKSDWISKVYFSLKYEFLPIKCSHFTIRREIQNVTFFQATPIFAWRLKFWYKILLHSYSKSWILNFGENSTFWNVNNSPIFILWHNDFTIRFGNFSRSNSVILVVEFWFLRRFHIWKC